MMFLSHRSLYTQDASKIHDCPWLSKYQLALPHKSEWHRPEEAAQTTQNTERLSISTQANKHGIIGKEPHRFLPRNQVRNAPGIRSKMRCFPGLMSPQPSPCLRWRYELFCSTLLKQISSFPLFISPRKKEEMDVAETFLDGLETYLSVVPARFNCLKLFRRKVGVSRLLPRSPALSAEMWFLLAVKAGII